MKQNTVVEAEEEAASMFAMATPGQSSATVPSYASLPIRCITCLQCVSGRVARVCVVGYAHSPPWSDCAPITVAWQEYPKHTPIALPSTEPARRTTSNSQS